MVEGTVKWFNVKKGFGFITPKEGDKDIFVHYSAITKANPNDFATLNEGDKVEFDTQEGQKGLEAKNVKITEKAPFKPRGRKFSGDRNGGDRGDRGDRSFRKRDSYY